MFWLIHKKENISKVSCIAYPILFFRYQVSILVIQGFYLFFSTIAHFILMRGPVIIVTLRIVGIVLTLTSVCISS